MVCSFKGPSLWHLVEGGIYPIAVNGERQSPINISTTFQVRFIKDCGGLRYGNIKNHTKSSDIQCNYWDTFPFKFTKEQFFQNGVETSGELGKMLKSYLLHFHCVHHAGCWKHDCKDLLCDDCTRDRRA